MPNSFHKNGKYIKLHVVPQYNKVAKEGPEDLFFKTKALVVAGRVENKDEDNDKVKQTMMSKWCIFKVDTSELKNLISVENDTTSCLQDAISSGHMLQMQGTFR